MALIKAAQTGDLQREAIVLDLGDLRRQAADLRAAAEATAERIVDEARRQAKALTDGAAERGHAEGLERGKAEGFEAGRLEGRAAALAEQQEQLQQLEQAWIEAAKRWDAERQAMVNAAQQVLLETAVAMAERIVRRVPQVDASIVADQIAAAIEHVSRPSAVRITIHPEDRALVEAAMPGVVAALGEAAHVALVDDATITRGGCVVRHGRGVVDATLETQLDRIVEAVLPKREGAAPSAEGEDQA